MEYAIKILHYATQRVPGPQAYFQSHWGEWVTFNYYAFLVRGDDVTMLVDCGMDDLAPLNELLLGTLGHEGVARPSPRESSITGLLAAEGLRPEDIDVVAFTHFHADHVANARLFTNARFLISAEGWRQHQRMQALYPDLVAEPVFPADVIAYLSEQAQDRLILAEDGPTTLPGVAVKHVGGHTADSAAFVLDTKIGRALIPGDTIWTYRNLEEDVPIGAAVSIVDCMEAMRWARSSADLVLPCHDPLLLDRHRDGWAAPR